MNKIKLTQVLNSRNFLTSVISILVLALGANGITSTDLGGSADQIYNIFAGKSGSDLLITIILYAINSGSRIYTTLKNKPFDFSFIKSSNFQAAVISLLAVVIGMIFKEDLAGYIIAIVTQVINIIYNLLLPAKSSGTLPTTIDSVKNLNTEK